MGTLLGMGMFIGIIVAGIGLEVVEYRRKRRVERNHRDYKNTRNNHE